MRDGKHRSKSIIHWGIFIVPMMIFIIAQIIALLPGGKMWMFSLPIIVIGLVYSIHCFIIYATTKLVLAEETYYIETGLLNKERVELPLDKKESIYIHRNLLGVIFGYGTLIIRGIGTGEYILRYMDNPEHYLKHEH